MNLASLVLAYRQRFEQKYAGTVTPSMQRAIEAVLACRTERYGHITLNCPQCQTQAQHYHSCGHRSCPACQHYDTGQWLARQTQKLLPVPYYMATFTVPRELRPLFWHHQRPLYGVLFDCAISTLKSFGLNAVTLGGELGLTGVLHTHSRRMSFHPHVHIIIPGGCFLRRKRQWKKQRGKYLFNEINLAKVFRARLLAAIVKAGFYLPADLPRQWVVHCDHVGQGLPALKYLSRYLYRGVIDENNILYDDGTRVTFRYRDSNTNTFKTRRCSGEHFLWLVFQHALPRGFRRVRDYGFLHGNASTIRQLIQLLLHVKLPEPEPGVRPAFICRRCRCPMRIIAFVPPSWRAG
jgi:endogenous inhibitor of DNA gyrase (YacG/DUF329 family)